MIEKTIAKIVAEALYSLFSINICETNIVLQPTRKDFEGDFTLVVFPYVKQARKSPEETASMIGSYVTENSSVVADYNVIKGFLNFTVADAVWFDVLSNAAKQESFGLGNPGSKEPIVVEYSSPNTNKPLHLGHIRNNLLGYSISRILQASGHTCYKVNLVNDRGIHICKSMLAWMKWGDGETPQSRNIKGDKLVGEFYVLFETELKKQIATATEKKDQDAVRNSAPLMKEARELLRKWEARDPDTVEIWKTMNGWVYDGFDETYARMGVDFDKIYYESETYLLGREIVLDGMQEGIFYKREDGSVWVDLSDEGLDEKLLLRSDGTSVYMTQDIGTAQLRYDDYNAKRMVYVVGNEQNYHFDVLKRVMNKLKKPYAPHLHHLSYGMVELPEGKMKSREGTVVDADDLMEEMFLTAKTTTEELGKIEGLSEAERNDLFETIGLGALKYFILKVDPKKNMLFNPKESIDFNGNTGPFIQYTHARIRSILRKAEEKGLKGVGFDPAVVKMNPKEKMLIRMLYTFPQIVEQAADEFSPALVGNYSYDLAKAFNQFYHDHSVLNEPDQQVSQFRLQLSLLTARVLKTAMGLLGIRVPEKM